MKNLLILGAFPQMIDIVMTANKMGIRTVIADRDPASPAKRFADKSYDVSTNEIAHLEEICRKENIQGIFTGFEDFNIHIARKLCERLNLPFYATKYQLETITNKLAFKEKCREHSVPVIEQYSLIDALQEEKYPYIVKPSDSYGSRGITVCRNQEELLAGYEKAEQVSASGTVILERFIDNDHGVELFYTVVNGKIHLTVTADRYTVRNGETTVPLPVAEVFPSKHRNDLIKKLDPSLRQMIRGLGLQNGLVLIQALYDGKSDFFVYEMAYRFTGEQHYRLVERQHGIRLSEMMIRAALGEDVSEYDTPLLDDVNFTKPSINLALVLKPGTIKEICGLEKVYQIDEVISYNVTHAKGDVVLASGDYSHMLIRINMVAENYEKLCRAVDLVDQFVTVSNDRNEDMLACHFHLPEES